MSSRPPESLEQMIRRCIRDARSVGETMGPARLAFAINAAGWSHHPTHRATTTPGQPPAGLVSLVAAFTRNHDPERDAHTLARLIAADGYRHVRNPVFPTRQDA